ncbi:MAG: transporter [Bacteroidia bacterium]|nr:transporter [Bacteroidia bacterium]NNM23427.1 transporter [Flavobacteriaceae bacterium]
MTIRLRFLVVLLLLPLFTFAQYTDMINTNRPGGSQGAFSVGKKVLQFETGLSIGKEEHRLLRTETNAFRWDYSARYGVWKEELEVSIIGSFQRNKVNDTQGIGAESIFSNFRSNTIGAKYLIYDPYKKKVLEGPNLRSWKANNRWQWSDLIPAVSIYAGANFDFADNPFTPELDSQISPKIVLSTQNNWIGGFVLVTNIIADRVTTDFPSYGYIITLTHATNDYFSIFLENQGFKSDFYADQLLRGGVAALINANFHVDLSGTINFKDTPSLWYVRAGMAYRFDMHSDDEFLEEKGKAGREARRVEKNKNRALKKEKKRSKKRKRQDGLQVDDEGDDGGLD